MMDDTGVPVIAGMPIKDGWRSEMVRVHGRAEDVFISPDGLRRYVKATENERADLIVHSNSKRFVHPLVVRLRLEKDSQLARKSRREQRLIKRGETSLEEEKQARTLEETGFVPVKHVRRKQ